MISKELIQSDFPTISRLSLVEEAAHLMRDHGLHALPVIQGSRLEGVIACEDIVYRGIADGKDWFFAHVEDFMTRDPVVAQASQSVSVTRDLMVAGKHKWLPVVNSEREYFGVVRSESLAAALAASE